MTDVTQTPIFQQFSQNPDAVRNERFKLAIKQMAAAQNRKILQLEEDISNKEMEIQNMLDIYPANSQDLKVNKSQAELQTLMDNLHEASLDLAELKIERQVAKETYEKLFEPKTEQ